MKIKNENQLKKAVFRAVQQTWVTDMHTHLFSPNFGPLLLKGPDECLTYHYLVAEALRWTDMPLERFWALSKSRQADLVWKALFIDHSPVSEACQGVLTAIKGMGLSLSSKNLDLFRKKLSALKTPEYVERVFKAAKVKTAVMTNDPFDEAERRIWLKGVKKDPRFQTALRLDSMVLSWDQAWPRMKAWGYGVGRSLAGVSAREASRFLSDWTRCMNPLYLMASFPPDFSYPGKQGAAQILDRVVLPFCRGRNLPFALMLGVKRQVNPGLRLAGDGVGRSDLSALENLCRDWPEVKFMATVLSRENQHELAVLARKFRNLMVFGCWWFMNVPSLSEETTRLRLDLLGLSFIPQHSDARVLDQLIYKWEHFRGILGRALWDQYLGLMRSGWDLDESEIARDVEDLLGGNFWKFINVLP